MAERAEPFVLKLDGSSFVEAMKRAVAAAERITDAWRHQRRHHQHELPWRSAMHASYDRRRRARRRRR